MGASTQSGGDRITLGSPTPARVILHVLPWAALFGSGLLGDLVSDGKLSLNVQTFSLLCYAVVTWVLIRQSHEVRLEPGAIHLRSWSSILTGGPAEEIVLDAKSQFYRDPWGRLFADGHEVRLYFGYGWKPLARWFERAGLPVFDDRADLEARYPMLRLIFPVLIPVLFAAALAVVWFYPVVFSGVAVAVGTLAMLASLVFSYQYQRR
jgi:hypothetical protein